MQSQRADQTRWFRALVVVLTLAALGSMVEGQARQNAERVAAARTLALKGAELREVDAVAARRLGAAAVSLHDDDQTRTALADTLANEGLTDLVEASRSDDVAMTTDGSFLLGRSGSGTVRRWYLPRGRGEPGALDFGGSVDELAMSADGEIVLTAESYEGVGVWRLGERTRPVKAAFLPVEEYFGPLVLSGDGRTALVSYGLDEPEAVAVEVWDLRSVSEPVRRATLKIRGPHLYDLALSADGRTAVAVRGGEPGAVVWDLTDQARPVAVGELRTEGHGEESVALSPDGRRALLGIGSGGGADVWDLTDRAKPVRLASLGGEFRDVFAVALARAGELALIADARGRAVLWDLTTPSHPVRLATLRTGGRSAEAVAMSEDGRTAALGSPMAGPRVWDLSQVEPDPLDVVCRATAEADVIPAETWTRYVGEEGAAYTDGDFVFCEK
ncbi:WD40 repeat domain-containing protein [Nonomuraea sp. NPDC050310]|uniref:WD40 repeat domain-containing protein n=1 Tax=Nonomuraea sp. NPDC050310 TaxID=3154935 RepID=UPI003410777B